MDAARSVAVVIDDSREIQAKGYNQRMSQSEHHPKYLEGIEYFNVCGFYCVYKCVRVAFKAGDEQIVTFKPCTAEPYRVAEHFVPVDAELNRDFVEYATV